MKTIIEIFQMDYDNSLTKAMLFKRLDALRHDPEKHQEEIDGILDQINKIKRDLKKYYKITE